MRNLLVLFVTAASFLLGACGPNDEESASTGNSAVKESAGTPISAVKKWAGTRISAAQLADRIQAGSPPLVLDVRSREKYAQGHIPEAINIPLGELSARLDELPIAKSEEVVVYDESGRGTARVAAESLRESGYSNVLLLAGHWQKWQTERLPTE